VLLSSHILPEVEKTCSHVVIIASGRIARSGSLEELKVGLSEGQRIILEVSPGKTGDGPTPAIGLRPAGGPAEMARVIGQVAGVAEVGREDAGDGWTRLRATPAPGADPRAALYAAVAGRGWTLREMHATAPTLEELYVQITAGDAALAASRHAAA
jgi:ABC-2 type transport system ATP-binding protein